MDYLGLGEDDAYDDYDDHDAVDRSGGVSRTGDPSGGFDDSRPVARQVSPRDTDPLPTPRRPQFDDSSVQPRPISARQGSSVRTLGGSNQGETHTVKAIRFNDIQEVANRFRDGYAVILNPECCDDEVARRMIDFSSGLCYALHGKIEKVARGVYLLKPDTRPVNPEY